MELAARSLNPYREKMQEFAGWVFGEREAVTFKGNWNSQFGNPSLPLDLEIGCGNGFFFEHQVRTNQNRNLLGIEIKYKPLVQSVRRVAKLGLHNGRGLRLHAEKIGGVFRENELNNIFIFFPDPWPKRRQKKHRLLKREFWNLLASLQKRDSDIWFKTDSQDYFDFVCEELKGLPFEQLEYSRDLHKSPYAEANFLTAFEKIFSRQGLPIYHLKLKNKKVQS